MTDVSFPSLSERDPRGEGVVATWFVADGEHVRRDQLIAEVQVDKVSADVVAPAAGTIRLHAQEAAVVHQGEVIAVIEAA